MVSVPRAVKRQQFEARNVAAANRFHSIRIPATTRHEQERHDGQN